MSKIDMMPLNADSRRRVAFLRFAAAVPDAGATGENAMRC